MVNYDRTVLARNPPTAGAQKWADQFETALKKLARVTRFELTGGGNVRSFLEVQIDGVDVPLIVIEEERKGSNYNVLKWVRVDEGSRAKFVKAPTKMAAYVVATYGKGSVQAAYDYER